MGEGVYVRALAIDRQDNTLWIGTSVGALEVDLVTRQLRGTYTRQQGLANEYVFSIFVDSQGNKWFGTDGGGASRYKNGEWKTYFPMHGLADYWIYSFAEQSDGTLWIGTWAGLNSIDKETGGFTTYLEELVNEWVYGLAVDSKDRLWIGTEGGVNMYDGKTWETWKHEDGLGAPDSDRSPVSTNTGLGTRSRHDLSVMALGMLTYNPNYVFDIQIDSQDNVWAGTWGGGVARYDGDKWTNFTARDGLAGNIVYSVAQGPDGVLWFGTNGGATRYDGSTWQTYTTNDRLLGNDVYSLAVDPAGDVWVGTRNGVVRLGK
ncbi:MAG: regulator [Gammaproteobacteria bacterium RBG_16_57_12]|nr:MAG: regulator [Gammaproteobacteria bacterium RBG_16_57_12]